MIKAKKNGARRFFSLIFHTIKQWWKLGYLKVAVLILIIAGLLLFKYWASEQTSDWRKTNPGFIWTVVDLIADPNTVAIFSSALITIIIWQISLIISSFSEERRKTTQDHHAIIRHYSSYAPKRSEDGKEVFNAPEHLMELKQNPRQTPENEKHFFPRYPTNRILEKKSAEFFQQEEANEVFMAEGKLYLPTINFFTNKNHDVTPVFTDSTTPYKLPEEVSGNLTAIFGAHSHSVTRNSDTVRLDDAWYSPETKTLELTTSRTTYYDMLMTNRCMDFDFGNGMTLRNLYEYRNRVSAFDESVLANQIGINGLIITKDGWLLLEKRSRKKSTWKGKYAQPISLSMQVNKLGFLPGETTIAPGLEGSKDVMSHLIRHTIRDNYGLLVLDYDELKKKRPEKEGKSASNDTRVESKKDSPNYEEDECYSFDGTIHFLGLARDLLEGGKPNLYYYVILGLDHKKLKEHLCELKKRRNPIPVESEMKAKKDAYESSTLLPKEKLQSGFVIAPYDSIVINMDYKMSFSPKADPSHSNKKPKVETIRTTKRKRGCGEALLVCLSYVQEMGGVDALIEEEKKENPKTFESKVDETKNKKDPA
jgi:hypothetical protein